jgi:ribose-phosphate pyrophosphokinase
VRPSTAPLRIVACAAAAPTAQGVARHLGVPLVQAEEAWFACGEGKFVLQENVRGADVYVVQRCLGPDARSPYDRFVMLLHAVEAAALSDAERITVVVPTYPGARQDKRKGRVREGISAGLFARMLQEAGAHRVVTVDIHNEAIAGMFDPAVCRLENVSATHRFSAWLRARGLSGDTVAAPDVGGLERARHMAAELGARLVALSKERDHSTINRVVRTTLIGDVDRQDVLLLDDIVDTAGSAVAAIEALVGHGARGVTLACVHPIFSGPAWERLATLHARAVAGGWRFAVAGTTAIPWADAPPWYHSFPLEPLLAQVLEKLHSRGSVTGAQQADDPDGTEELPFSAEGAPAPD